jgi:glyoxylate reductase
MKQKILITRAVFPEVIEHLSQHFEVESNQSDEAFSEAELIRRLQGKAGVYANPTTLMSADVIRSAPGLRAICNMAVGYNNIDVPAASAAGIMVTNTPDVLNETTADFGWTLLMATARRVTESEHFLRAGLWKKWSYDAFMGVDVHGSTLGIIGMGRIGQAIARRSMGFNMKVIYFGLAVAYAVNDDGTFALVGRPGEGGWKFDERPELAGEITRLIATTVGDLDAAFISLPFSKP